MRRPSGLGAFFLGLLILGMLTACSSNPPKKSEPVVASPSMTLVQKRMMWREQLAATGAIFIRKGEQFQFVLPAKVFFFAHASHAKPALRIALSKMAQLMATYPKRVARVIGHNGDGCMCARDLALSRERAHYVANYLWHHPINTRMLLTSTKGSCKPISQSHPADNSRVEVIFYTSSP